MELQVKAFSDNKVIFSFGDCILADKQNYPLDIQYYRQNKNNLNNSPVGSILNLFQDVDFYIAPVTAMIRKKTLLKIKGFNNDKIYPFVDIPTFLNLSLEGDFAYINDVLGYYRKHEHSSWFTYAKKTQAMGKLELVSYLNYFVSKNKKVLKEKNISLFDKTSSTKQEKILNNKKKEKYLSLIKHEIAFGNYSHAKSISKNLLQKKELTTFTKAIALITASGLITNEYTFRIAGFAKLLFYKFTKK